MSTVFQALSDPVRRSILDRLRHDGPLSVTDVADPLSMTRQGATKHLDVLIDSGLVEVRREGRRRMHRLNAVPLEEVQAWLAPYAAEWDRRLERLRAHVEPDDRSRADDPTLRREDPR